MGQEDMAGLYVVAAAGTETGALAAVLEAARPATVLIAANDGEALTAAAARPLLELVQGKNIAAMIEGDAQLARTLRADGVHLPWEKDIEGRYGEAREILGTRYIVGVDVGRSRHDAMVLAEAGADYIAFGIPTHVEDRETAAARRLELVAWWGEIFEVPCVAFDVDNAADAEALAAAGADFVALAKSNTLNADDYANVARAIEAASAQREALA
ncbi:MAG TPA: thiamine phosphate synthase [Hyphomicrobium sp.]|nr:thiamine phosphate synthase [Hyphomicrobium sp.]